MNNAKNVFKHEKTHSLKVMYCCLVKVMFSYKAAELAAVGRERMGGGG